MIVEGENEEVDEPVADPVDEEVDQGVDQEVDQNPVASRTVAIATRAASSGGYP